jgi:hypothetical protein
MVAARRLFSFDPRDRETVWRRADQSMSTRLEIRERPRNKVSQGLGARYPIVTRVPVNLLNHFSGEPSGDKRILASPRSPSWSLHLFHLTYPILGYT